MPLTDKRKGWELNDWSNYSLEGGMDDRSNEVNRLHDYMNHWLKICVINTKMVRHCFFENRSLQDECKGLKRWIILIVVWGGGMDNCVDAVKTFHDILLRNSD